MSEERLAPPTPAHTAHTTATTTAAGVKTIAQATARASRPKPSSALSSGVVHGRPPDARSPDGSSDVTKELPQHSASAADRQFVVPLSRFIIGGCVLTYPGIGLGGEGLQTAKLNVSPPPNRVRQF